MAKVMAAISRRSAPPGIAAKPVLGTPLRQRQSSADAPGLNVYNRMGSAEFGHVLEPRGNK